MGHSSVRASVRRRKVAQLAANSRRYTVRNNTVPSLDINKKNTVRIWHEIQLTKYDTPIYGKLFEIDKDGHYHLIEVDNSWKQQRHKQPKNLRKKYKKKYYCKGTHDIRKIVEHPSDYDQFKNYPYTLPKMNKIEYCEKLVEHKLAKWERKNPKPADMFTEDVEKWNQLREVAKERFRDFVVSIYDPLPLTGRFVVAKEGSTTYTEEKVAEIKDINGEGHKVNELPKDSKLLKKAQKITDETKAKRKSLVATNLKDHKRQHGRIILPKAA